mgnify:CR=1 FL=1
MRRPESAGSCAHRPADVLHVHSAFSRPPRSPPGVWLHEYLHGLFESHSPASLPFHDMQPALYASHAPELLVPFLKSSERYDPELALCVARDAANVDAQVLLLCKMGRVEQESCMPRAAK